MHALHGVRTGISSVPMAGRTTITVQRSSERLPVTPLTDQDPPPDLSPVAADIWREMMEQLAPLGILATLDKIAFSRMCECYADWCAAREALAQYGTWYYTDEKGLMRLHPAVQVMQDADRRLRSWLQDFGMTPLARARWRSPAVAPSAVPDDFDFSGLTQAERDFIRNAADRREAETVEEEAA